MQSNVALKVPLTLNPMGAGHRKILNWMLRRLDLCLEALRTRNGPLHLRVNVVVLLVRRKSAPRIVLNAKNGPSRQRKEQKLQVHENQLVALRC